VYLLVCMCACTRVDTRTLNHTHTHANAHTHTLSLRDFVENLVSDWFSMDFFREKDQNKVHTRPHPTPYPLNPKPNYTLHPTPYTLHPAPPTLDTASSVLAR
jgi:hypothetical protein